jgi:hypothetical protein
MKFPSPYVRVPVRAPAFIKTWANRQSRSHVPVSLQSYFNRRLFSARDLLINQRDGALFPNTVSRAELFLKFKDIHDSKTYPHDGTPLGDYSAGSALAISLTPPWKSPQTGTIVT